jgi:hypothetical protein
MDQHDMPKARAFCASVTVTRQGHEDRIIPVRITRKTLERMGLDGMRNLKSAARNRAAEVMYGRGCRFHSDMVAPHRGQVWASAKGGGSNAVTGVITMRVEER